mmetsp:Transcript_39877/g.82921  ORF Transcript_39877/g.82921 Transcript_39877/m.82921 type:complete len:161 (-) Transcript_39877:30-512(-)
MTKMRIEHHAVPQLTNGRLVLAAILLLGRFFLISGQSISDERCNICGCNLNECTFGQSVATLQFDYQGQPYRQNCFWLNDQINRPNSPFDLDWCKNELPPIVLEKCACFYLTTGEDVPIPAGSTSKLYETKNEERRSAAGNQLLFHFDSLQLVVFYFRYY